MGTHLTRSWSRRRGRLYRTGGPRTMGEDLPPCRHLLRLFRPQPDEAFPVALPLYVKKLLIRSGIARWLPSVRRLTDGGAEFLHYYSDRVLAAPHADL